LEAFYLFPLAVSIDVEQKRGIFKEFFKKLLLAAMGCGKGFGWIYDSYRFSLFLIFIGRVVTSW
jgi:hypothetical protein